MLGYCFMFTWFPPFNIRLDWKSVFKPNNQLLYEFGMKARLSPLDGGDNSFLRVLWVYTFTLRRRRKRMKGEKEKLPNLAFSAKPNMTLTQIKPEVFLNKKETYTLSHSYLYFSQEYHYLICAVLCWIMTGPTYIYCGRWEIAFFSATTFYIMKYL